MLWFTVAVLALNIWAVEIGVFGSTLDNASPGARPCAVWMP